MMVQHNPNSTCEAEDKWMVSWGTVGRAGTDTREVFGTFPTVCPGDQMVIPSMGCSSPDITITSVTGSFMDTHQAYYLSPGAMRGNMTIMVPALMILGF